MTSPPIRALASLTPPLASAVLEAAAACEREDGHPPLSEQTRLDLGAHPAGVTHLVASSTNGASTVAGYAYVDLRDPAGNGGAELELFVRPGHRRAGIGRTLVAEAMEVAASRRLQAWAHGTLPGAQRLAEQFAFAPVRRLLRLGRTLEEAPPSPATPDELTLRPFSPADLPGLAATNAAAFASHPEQGRLTVDDLARRTAEAWFDAGDLLLLVRADAADAAPVGFFWGKVDTDVQETRRGEVYVLGVDPSAAGRGLGTVLLAQGLARLHARGVRRVDLYVEADNAPALRLYRREGFTELSTDTRYAGPR